MKSITKSLKVIALALILSVGISYVSAWTAPTVTPPNGNVSAPLNVGGTDQTKLGSISAASFWDSNDPVNFYVNPNGDSKVKNVFATSDVCIFGTATCLSTVGGIQSETDPTVITSVKDGISWSEITGIPGGFSDGVDNTGVTVVPTQIYSCPQWNGLMWSGSFLSTFPSYQTVIADSGTITVGCPALGHLVP